jgi:hypothetical protein
VPHNGGRALINFWNPKPYYECIFLDAFKQMEDTWQGAGTSEDWYALFDERGYPTRMPTGGGATWVSSGLWIDRPTAGEVWVLDWPGTATVTLTHANATQSIISSNRREYTFTEVAAGNLETGYPNPASLVTVTISSMSANAFVGGQIRLYKKAYESRVVAGEIFDPRYFDRVRYFGVQRFLDWTLAGGQDNNCVNWEHRPSADTMSYVAGRVLPTLWAGVSTGTNDQVISQPSAAISSWTNGQVIQWAMTSRPLYGLISAATNANPGVFTWVGHPLATNDIIEFENRSSGANQSWRNLAQVDQTTGDTKTFTVTKIDPDTFSIGVDTTSFGAYAANLLTAYKQITVKVGSLPAVPCLRMQSAITFFPAVDFSDGRPCTGVYDAALGKILLGGAAMTLKRCGAPYEIMMRLAIDSGAHPWINLPIMADDNYVTQFATLIKSLQPSWMIPRTEVGNEEWNYWGTGWLAARSKKDPVLNSYNVHLGYGKRCGEVGDLVGAVYAGGGKQMLVSIGVQGSNSDTTTINQRLRCPPVSGYVNAGTPGTVALYPASKCHALHYNPYYQTAFFNRTAASYNSGAFVNAVYDYLQGGAARTAAFNWMRDEFIYATNDVGFSNSLYLNNWRDTWGPIWVAQTASLIGRDGVALTLFQYEGGPDPNANGHDGGFPTTHAGSGTTITVANVQAFMTAFQQSSQYAALLRKQMQDAADLGVQFPAQYAISGAQLSGNAWGLWITNDFNAAPTRAYTELLDWNNRKRRITFDGV